MKALVAPLDWGLGHATRCIPVVREFLSRGWSVDLAVAGNSMAALYRGEFPELLQVPVPEYSIRYPSRGFEMPFWILKNYLRIAEVIRRENAVAESLVREREYDVLLSDNRFGFHSRKAFCIYMTHQRRILFPDPFSALENVGVAWHRKRMRAFDAVWVPDVPDVPGLSGRLSHGLRGDVKFVGPLSRFSKFVDVALPEKKRFRFVALLSGPEPMRSQFEKAVLSALEKIPGEHAVIRGLPGCSDVVRTPPNVTLYNHLESADLARTVLSAETVVSRPGYSTVMDMAVLGARCVFVPTPGQTEQVYLGRSLASAGLAGLLFQGRLSPQSLLLAEKSLQGPLLFPSGEGLLSRAVDDLTLMQKEMK